MKRFYTAARAEAAEEGGWRVLLDGKPIHTPGRRPLVLSTDALAEAVANEWSAQGDTIDPRAMRLTGLANAALDRIAPEREAFAAGLARYGESDLLCYRAETPPRLVARQAEHWDPVLAWARRRFDVSVEVCTGLMHRAQPAETLERLTAAVAARDAFALAGLAPLVTVSGSLLIGLALAEGALSLDAAWAAAALDELWQAELWGEDEEAAKALADRRADFEAGARFLVLL